MNDVVREEKTVDEGFVNTLEDSSEEKGLDTKHIKWNNITSKEDNLQDRDITFRSNDNLYEQYHVTTFWS